MSTRDPMPQPTAAEIATLCDNWCDASSPSGAGFSIGGHTEKFRLLRNGLVFHELDHERLCATLMGLSKVLLRPGLNTIVDHDHFALWSWCGELLLSPIASLYPSDQREIKSLYETVIHAALANCQKPPASKEEWQAQSNIRQMQPHHATQLLHESSLVLAYLAFPLLEAVLKRACATFVSLDGMVISSFSIPKRSGKPRQYDPGDQCSSLRDLLFLHYISVAATDLQVLLDGFRRHIQSFDVNQDPFDLIYSWRNQSLHGSANFQTIGGTILNLCLLISLFEIRQGFHEYRGKIVARCKWEAQSQSKSPWSFYPPY